MNLLDNDLQANADHTQDMNQALVTIMFTKAVALLVVSSKVAGWYQAVGARSVMNTCAGINIGISLFTIPAYIYGKRFRSIVSVPWLPLLL